MMHIISAFKEHNIIISEESSRKSDPNNLGFLRTISLAFHLEIQSHKPELRYRVISVIDFFITLEIYMPWTNNSANNQSEISDEKRNR